MVSWDGYLIPGTDVLRNRLGLSDAKELAEQEYLLSVSRGVELEEHPQLVSRTFDETHLCAIHRHLLQDVYDWAGEIRTVPIFKGSPGGFADPHSGSIGRYLKDAARVVEETLWAGMDHDEFASQAAEVFALVNQAHPFRDGNGRASKVFMQHVAGLAGFGLDFSRVSPGEWNKASMLSGPDLGSYAPVPASLVPVFARIATPAVQVQSLIAGRDEVLLRIKARAARLASQPSYRPYGRSGPVR